MMAYKDMTAENAEHNEWLKGLDFYRDDLKIHERRLLELAGRSADPEISKGVEHFQNQFLIQRNTMDELRHSIREHAAEFGRNVARGDAYQAERMSMTHEALRDGFRSFEKVINELRHEFNSFLSHDHF